jgi:hypothetical protein
MAESSEPWPDRAGALELEAASHCRDELDNLQIGHIKHKVILF